MTVTFYNFSKRPNSTLQPTGGTSLTAVQIKEECSFENPVLKIGNIVSGAFSPSLFNYVYIPLWSRYYYITDWKYLNGIWECYLKVDVLASFKTAIGTTNTYIERCASASDGTIIDSFYPAKSNPTVTTVNASCAWYNVAYSGFTAVLGVINNDTTFKIGAVTYYALTVAELKAVLAYLFSSNIYNASSINEIGEGLYKSMFNPFQYIVSCMIFPFSTVSFAGNTVVQSHVKVGYWDTGVNGIIVESIFQKGYVTATIPDHPQISRGSYLNRAPYTRLTLYLPPFGAIPIDTNVLSRGSYLYSPFFVDNITGQITIRISTCPSALNLDETNIATERTSQIGVPIQLAQVMSDYVNSIGSGISAVSSLVTGNIGGAINSALNAIQCQMPTVSTSGANGSTIEVLPQPILMVENLLITDDDNAEFGKPLCAKRVINTLSGYIKCSDADHAFNGTLSEIQEINDYMRNGFFYE